VVALGATLVVLLIRSFSHIPKKHIDDFFNSLTSNRPATTLKKGYRYHF
jgi:hypothetical protein